MSTGSVLLRQRSVCARLAASRPVGHEGGSALRFVNRPEIVRDSAQIGSDRTGGAGAGGFVARGCVSGVLSAAPVTLDLARSRSRTRHALADQLPRLAAPPERLLVGHAGVFSSRRVGPVSRQVVQPPPLPQFEHMFVHWWHGSWRIRTGERDTAPRPSPPRRHHRSTGTPGRPGGRGRRHRCSIGHTVGTGSCRSGRALPRQALLGERAR